MKYRPSYDETEHTRTARPANAEPFGLFAQPDLAPDIRTSAASAPGSETSRFAAEAITNSPFRRASWRRVMLALASAGRPLTREELSERAEVKESSLCARLSELRPEWVQVAGQVMGSSGVLVDTYSLTAAGRARCVASNV